MQSERFDRGTWLIRLWRKERAKPRVFLGTLAVVPRGDVKWVLEDMFGDSGQEIEGHLHDQLQEIFALAPASTADPVLKTDLGVDVFIPEYYGGESLSIDLGDWMIWLIPLALLIPLFWRPKIELRARLYRLHDRKLVKTFAVRERPTYRECWSPDFSWRGMFGLKRPYGDSETARILDRASLRLLKKIAAFTYA